MYWTWTRPFSHSTISNVCRSLLPLIRRALRHSTTNLRSGAAPTVSVRTVAVMPPVVSMTKSSQKAYTAAFGVAVLGSATLLKPGVTLPRKLTWPLVLTNALV